MTPLYISLPYIWRHRSTCPPVRASSIDDDWTSKCHIGSLNINNEMWSLIQKEWTVFGSLIQDHCGTRSTYIHLAHLAQGPNILSWKLGAPHRVSPPKLRAHHQPPSLEKTCFLINLFHGPVNNDDYRTLKVKTLDKVISGPWTSMGQRSNCFQDRVKGSTCWDNHINTLASDSGSA